MFLRLHREDLSPGRLKKAVPLFLLLWLAGLVLGTVSVLAGRTHLLSVERIETENLLAAYLAAHQAVGGHFGILSLQQSNVLPGLVFVRVQQGGSQLLLTGNRGSSGFRELAELSPEQEGVWVPAVIGGKLYRLTLVSREYPNGLRIQVAKDGNRGYLVYRRMLFSSVAVVIVSAPLFFLFSLFLIKLSFAPLVDTTKRVALLATSVGDKLLPEKGSGPELDLLCHEINSLLRRNQQLMLSMQQSLDNVAHDLRTPMTRLRSVAEYGLQSDRDSEQLREALADCLEESERVLAMLRIMMSVAEAEAGTMRLEKEACDLAVLLEQVVELYEYVAEERAITITLEAEPIQVRVDPTRFSQVLANLVDNGIKYTGDKGWVKLSAREEKGQVIIEVEDNGMGISKSEQERIWERLYRGDRSRSRQGLGLGLNYVRAVVRAHGGEVTVTSTLHEGSRFLLRLPGDQMAEYAPQEKSQISGE